MNAIGGAAIDTEIAKCPEQAANPHVVGRVEAQLDMAIDQPDGEILIRQPESAEIRIDGNRRRRPRREVVKPLLASATRQGY